MYISVFFWLFPPIRQFGGNYFFYFLILALSDPINMLFVGVFHFPQTIIHPIAGVFLIYTINTKEINFRKYWYIHLFFIVALIVSIFTLENRFILFIALHLIVLIRFIKLATLSLFNKNTLNIYYIVLCFYELLTVIDAVVFSSNIEMKIVFFYTSLLLQTLIAVFFTIFREDSSSLKIQLKTAV